MTKSDKKRRSAKKELRDNVIKAKVAAGQNISDIADELGMARQTVSKIVNNDAAVTELVKQAEFRLAGMVHESLDVVERALKLTGEQFPIAVSAAFRVLKSKGIVKDKVELTHQFPKPTVIKRADGTEVILGSKEEK